MKDSTALRQSRKKLFFNKSHVIAPNKIREHHRAPLSFIVQSIPHVNEPG